MRVIQSKTTPQINFKRGWGGARWSWIRLCVWEQTVHWEESVSGTNSPL